MRQGRKFIIPRRTQQFTPMLEAPKPNIAATDIYKKLNLDEFDERQEQDIQEIAQFLSQKYTNPEAEEEVVFELFVKQKEPAKSREKTCRQMTQNLIHCYKPQLAQGLTAVIQIQISGAESFNSYVDIRNAECEFYDGLHDSPDMTILADVAVWSDVLKGKLTAQKAFMIGRLKVRGNFVLLTRFDQLFAPVS